MTGNPVPPSDDTLSHVRTLHESGHHANAEVVLLDAMKTFAMTSCEEVLADGTLSGAKMLMRKSSS